MKWKLQLDSEMKIHEKCAICKRSKEIILYVRTAIRSFYINLLAKLFHFYNENHKNIHRKIVETI